MGHDEVKEGQSN